MLAMFTLGSDGSESYVIRSALSDLRTLLTAFFMNNREQLKLYRCIVSQVFILVAVLI